MRSRTNRLLMLLISAALTGCASQTERSSSGGGAESAVEYERVGGTTNVVTREELERRAAAEAAAAAAAAEQPQPVQQAEAPAASGTEYAPEEVQYIDRPLEETPAPAAAAAAAPSAAAEPTPGAAADEALPDFPITKYEIDESAGDDQAAEVDDLGTQPDESAMSEGNEEAVIAAESGVGEPTEFADEPEQVAEEPHEVDDLGTQPDESSTAGATEEYREPVGSGVGEPTTYPDEPVQQAAAPASISVNFEAEPLFNFDKAAVRADQRQALDDFVASLQGVTYDEIMAVGHADRLGSEAYNQRLSERRANAVKAYLVSKGVESGKIRAEGRGESEGITGDTCGTSRGKALISCLQPDRRVDVSVNGSKNN